MNSEVRSHLVLGDVFFFSVSKESAVREPGRPGAGDCVLLCAENAR